MVLKSQDNYVGAWAFLIGVVLAVLIGLSASLVSIPIIRAYSAHVYTLLVVLGLVIGFSIKITGRDSQTFLLAGTILVIVSRFGMESVTGSLIGFGIGDTVSTTFATLLTLFAPATIVVALKTVFSLERI